MNVNVEDSFKEQNTEVQNLALIETHLQVNNVVKILFTINPNILDQLVSGAPPALRASPHFKVLEASLAYYLTLLDINSPGSVKPVEEVGEFPVVQ